MNIYTFILALALSACSTAPRPSKLSQKICNDINQGKEFKYPEHYSKKFQNSIPREQLAGIFEQVISEYGKCLEVINYRKTTTNIRFSTKHSSGKILDYTLVDKQGVATGLWLHGEKAKPVNYKDFQAVVDDFNQLPSPRLLIQVNKKNKVELNSNKRTPLGSIFKIFVLDSLNEEIKNKNYSWSSDLKIKEQWKSLPSGVMQDEPVGKSFELRYYAQQMISISDNTATDHLIHTLGKTKIEKQIKRRKLSKTFGWSRPFLTTMELFKIRASFSPYDYKTYAADGRTARMLKIQKLPTSKDEKFFDNISKWQEPRGLFDAQWFSTPNEVCQLLSQMSLEANPEVLTIMSKNTPFASPEKFKRVLYKGGSEPGLVQMAYLLNKENEEICLYAGIADTANLVDEAKFFEKIKAIMELLN